MSHQDDKTLWRAGTVKFPVVQLCSNREADACRSPSSPKNRVAESVIKARRPLATLRAKTASTNASLGWADYE